MTKLQKKIHITLLALLMIQVFVFFNLYNFDMFMLYHLGKFMERRKQGVTRA